jgi:hypothetical protein
VTYTKKRPFDEFSATTTSLPHPGGNCGEFEACSENGRSEVSGSVPSDEGILGRHLVGRSQ